MKITNKLLIFATSLLGFQSLAVAQEREPYTFKADKQLAATPVKNQQQTGTCWAFSCASFLESEVKRISNLDVDLSEMYVVRSIYREKCENYVRRQGNAQFGEGGLAHDLIRAVQRYGIVPETEYSGRKNILTGYDHSKLEAKLKDKCVEFAKLGKDGKLPKNWLTTIDGILDDEFGKVPTKFTVDGRQFTPSIYRDFLGIKTEDYVTITSFTHHPFYEPFILEIPDNFANGTMYNLPLDEMMRALNHSLEQGYSVEWDADVSNDGFSAKNGLAIVPAKKWDEKTEIQREGSFKFIEPQPTVTQALRQELFDQQVTMDDHLMHITGTDIETTQSEKYYRVKNSWGEISALKGYLRVSEAYMRLNTISFMVNKSALPADIRKSLGLGEIEGSPTGSNNDLKVKDPAKIKRIKPMTAPTSPQAPKSE
jgi:bleomycin hydrolase